MYKGVVWENNHKLYVSNNVIVKLSKKYKVSPYQLVLLWLLNIGNNVTIAGKVAIIDHLNIEDNVTILTGSCVFKSIKSNSLYSGNPARPHKNRVKEDIIISKLPDMYKNFIKK